MKKYLLGMDFGGGASKAALLSEDGTICARNAVEYPTYYPENGACEQSPDDWIAALCENSAAVIEKSGIDPENIAAVALDAPTHTCVLCDENAKPLRPAVYWTDLRSRAEAKELFNNRGEEIFEKTYHLPDTIWTLPQLRHIKNAEPEVFGKIKKIFFEKDYIRYFLTGVFCTDYIEAEGSMLFDCRKKRWDEELCALAGVDPRALPPIVSPKDIIGTVTREAASATGLCEGTPVICGTSDTAAEIFASGAVEPGDVTVKLATAGRICVITEKPYPDRHLVNYSHIVNGLYYPGTATKSAASAYRWFRDAFGGDYRDLDALAGGVPVGSEGLVFHPYLNGELTPYADPALCGSFTGLRATHGKAHFARAVLEGVALSLYDCKNYLDGLRVPRKDSAVLIGGGAKGIWKNIASDVLGMPLRLTENSDSSLGSAMLAGVACGVFENEKKAVSLCVKPAGEIKPDMRNHAEYQKIFEKYKKIHDALAPIYRENA